tara:strand:- start:871 stop:2232 length:1362 start_codon:yes stop_codon:yes gene_type:complete
MLMADALFSQVGGEIAEQRLITKRAKVLVGVSGGVDSIVLLHVLNALASANSWKLAVAHFNHRLRGRDSNSDERFVRRLADRLGLRCFVGEADVSALAKNAGESIEMAARKARHQFFADAAREWGCRRIALAHHSDDQIELFFIRLLRGAGIDGLTGMPAVSPSPADKRLSLVRPLLGISRTEIEAFAQRLKLKFREDSSNRDTRHLRNRVRHDLLPILRGNFQPGLDQVILRTLQQLGDEKELADQAAGFLSEKSIAFEELPAAAKRRIIHAQLIRKCETPSFKLIDALVDSNAPVVHSEGKALRRVGGELVEVESVSAFEDEPELVLTPMRAWQTRSLGSRTVRFRVQSGKMDKARKDPDEELFDFDRIGPNITLRHWRPGDRYRPIGMKQSKKLQDCFVNQKIPKTLRHQLLVATTAGGEIFWVEGLRIAEFVKLTSGTRGILRWQLEQF